MKRALTLLFTTAIIAACHSETGGLWGGGESSDSQNDIDGGVFGSSTSGGLSSSGALPNSHVDIVLGSLDPNAVHTMLSDADKAKFDAAVETFIAANQDSTDLREFYARFEGLFYAKGTSNAELQASCNAKVSAIRALQPNGTPPPFHLSACGAKLSAIKSCIEYVVAQAVLVEGTDVCFQIGGSKSFGSDSSPPACQSTYCDYAQKVGAQSINDTGVGVSPYFMFYPAILRSRIQGLGYGKD